MRMRVNLSLKGLKGGKLVLGIIGVILTIIGFILFFVPFFQVFMMNEFPDNIVALPFLGFVFIFVGSILLTVAKIGSNKGNVNINNHQIYDNINEDNYGHRHPSRNQNVEKLIPCPKCMKFVDAESQFCSSCGQALHKYCKYCNTENSGDASFCSACGKSIE